MKPGRSRPVKPPIVNFWAKFHPMNIDLIVARIPNKAII